MLRQRMRCDVPPFSLANYDFIMQCRDDRPRSKVLNELKEKYSTSQKSGLRGITLLSNINVVGRQTESEIQGQDGFPFTELEKQIRDDKIEPSKSIDSVLEEGGKAKKTGGKKSKSKSILAELIPSSVQSQLIPTSHEKIA
ncbi:hypothetical protein C1645_817462 [Glomus cerebriforme]|uniref:Uncharacterized protein n=1 Tax=Glomus cerebriforme TaxID=658196 RepID=A0A397TAH8_9GLOM|nr:hypothetical protein C1645_817462 [Glomus cerebriforme]